MRRSAAQRHRDSRRADRNKSESPSRGNRALGSSAPLLLCPSAPLLLCPPAPLLLCPSTLYLFSSTGRLCSPTPRRRLRHLIGSHPRNARHLRDRLRGTQCLSDRIPNEGEN